MSNPRQRVIGYGRVSTEEQESNYSLEAQRSRFEHLCNQNRWQSLGFFPETGSGTSVINRPVLCNILRRIQQGGIDALWVKETDRLSRPENLGDLSLISQTLESTNTLLIVDSRILDLREDNSVLMLDFEGVLAKHFRRQLLRNMNRGKVRKAELGRKAGGSDICGYRTNDNGEYVPMPEEAKTVQLIFALAGRDYTHRQIGTELKRRGIATKLGRPNWSVAILNGLLRNDIYLGIYRFHKSRHGKDSDGSRYKVNRTDQIVVGSPDKPNHPPLVSPELFAIVQQKLTANRHKNSIRLYMATGLLRCQGCQSPIHVRYSSAPKGGRIEKYVCSNRPNCPSKRINVAETNNTLWGALVQLLVDPDRIHSLIAASPEDAIAILKKELDGTDRENKALKEKQERLLNLYLEGNIPQASYVVKSSQFEIEAEAVSERRADLQRRIQNHGKRDISAELIQTLRVLARSHRRFTEEQKTKVFRSIVKEARITETSVELELYTQPTQNVWWKYRQKASRKKVSGPHAQTVRIGIPQPHRPDNHFYSTGQDPAAGVATHAI